MSNPLDKFIQERNEVMLSLDKKRIYAYCRKYGVEIPKDEETFWIGVHKSITGITGADRKKRLASVKWLLAREMGHFMSDLTKEEEIQIITEIAP